MLCSIFKHGLEVLHLDILNLLVFRLSDFFTFFCGCCWLELLLLVYRLFRNSSPCQIEPYRIYEIFEPLRKPFLQFLWPFLVLCCGGDFLVVQFGFFICFLFYRLMLIYIRGRWCVHWNWDRFWFFVGCFFRITSI